MRTPVAPRLIAVTALGVAAIALAACGATGGPSSGASPSVASPSVASPSAGSATAAKPPAAPVVAHPAQPVAIGERQTSVGLVLTNPAGRTLYTYRLDKGAGSHCTGPCAITWPPLMVAPHASLTSSVSLPHALGTIARPDGMQATYDGHPLYLFAGDKAPGETKGQAVMQLWFVATPVGRASMVTPGPAETMTPPTGIRSTAPPTVRPLRAPIPPRMAPPRVPVVPNPIPQGGGGDHDSDNFGGPNDGDGNV